MNTRTLGRDGPRVSAIGLGGMLLSIAGRPPDDQARATIRAALEAGITLIDTADAYCLDETEFNHNERLIARTIKDHPNRITITTKIGCRRPGGAWTVDARPEYLKKAADRCLEALNVRTIDVLQLHAPDARVPFEDTIGALAELRAAGKARHIGLCNVKVSQIEEARKIVPIVSVQNRWNPEARDPEKDGVLDYCTKNEIAFIAYSPFGGTRGAPTLSTQGRLADQARKRRVSPYRLLLAWMLAKSPVVIAIPGARRPESIKDSAEAGNMELDPTAVQAIQASLPPI